jgi:hypothetical protein
LSPIISARGLSLGKIRSDVISSRWRDVFADIAHLLLVWSFSLNDDPNLVLCYDVDVFKSMFLACHGATPV